MTSAIAIAIATMSRRRGGSTSVSVAIQTVGPVMIINAITVMILDNKSDSAIFRCELHCVGYQVEQDLSESMAYYDRTSGKQIFE